MAQDTAMSDDIDPGNRQEYPEPTTSNHTPYPILSTDGATPLRQQDALSPDTNSSASERGSTTPIDSNYATPTTYFGLNGHGGPVDYDDSIQYEPQRRRQHEATPNVFHSLADTDNVEPLMSIPEEGQARGRGRRRPRGRPRGSSRGSGRKRGWKWALQGTQHADLLEKPKAKRTRGSGPKKRGLGSDRAKRNVNATGEHWMDPGPQFRTSMAQATAAWLDGDDEAALNFAKQAVQTNSEVFVAHKMISDILQAQGDERGAVVALSVGANTKRDASLWASVGNSILDLPDRTNADFDWARTCFVEALRIQSFCYEARMGDYRLAKETQDWEKARKCCKFISKKWPGGLELVSEYAELCRMAPHLVDSDLIKDAYQAAFEHYVDKDIFVYDVESLWEHLDLYTDQLLSLCLYQDGIRQIKRLSRWFLGRKEDDFWDFVDDDREYDMTDERRLQVWQFRDGHVNIDPSLYGDGLPLELRVKLGLFRLKLSSWRRPSENEALAHFAHLLQKPDALVRYHDMILEVAESLRSVRNFTEALKYYEAIKSLQGGASNRFWLGSAACYMEIGHIAEATRCYEMVVATDESNVEARVGLARLYSATGQAKRAVQMAAEVTEIGRLDAIARHEAFSRHSAPVHQAPPRTLPVLAPRANGQAHAEASRIAIAKQPLPITAASPTPPLEAPTHPRTKRARVHAHHAAIIALWVDLEDYSNANVSRWLREANAFKDEFKATSRFYVIAEYAKVTAEPNANSLPQSLLDEMSGIRRRTLGDEAADEPKDDGVTFLDFHGISMAECHRIFAHLTLLYAKRADQKRCYDVLTWHLVKPIVMRNDKALWNLTQAVRISCAFVFNDSKLLSEIAQDCVARGKKGSNVGAVLQLLAATIRLCHTKAPHFDARTVNWIQTLLEKQEQNLAAEGDRGHPTPLSTPAVEADIDPSLLTICGNNALAYQGSAGKPALPYLFRALKLQPDNLVINLSIAMAYVAAAMRKDATDRNYDIALAQTFFYRYYDLRVTNGSAGQVQEAEFNLGRFWHQLGLIHLAIPAYEKVLRLSGDVQLEHAENAVADDDTETEDFAVEAAFALQKIFVAAGDDDAARAIGEEWLVL